MSEISLGFPDGWFAVAYSDELAPGEVRRARYFDRELAIFRDDEGAVAMLDAHCPHLGAHLAEGGTVRDGAIHCPLHGWRFARDGTCLGSPYSASVPRGVRARAWAVREVSGVVLAWHHAGGADPDYEIPPAPEWGASDWTGRYTRGSWSVATHPQEVMENAVDWPHYERVHAMPAPEERAHRFEDRSFTWTIGASVLVHDLDPKRENFLIAADNWGLGVSWVRYNGMYRTLAFMGLTPVDRRTTEIRLGLIGKRDGRSEDQTHAALDVYLRDQAAAMSDDIRIWESKIYLADPPLCEGDGPIREFRRWAARFYSGTPSHPRE